MDFGNGTLYLHVGYASVLFSSLTYLNNFFCGRNHSNKKRLQGTSTSFLIRDLSETTSPLLFSCSNDASTNAISSFTHHSKPRALCHSCPRSNIKSRGKIQTSRAPSPNYPSANETTSLLSFISVQRKREGASIKPRSGNKPLIKFVGAVRDQASISDHAV